MNTTHLDKEKYYDLSNILTQQWLHFTAIQVTMTEHHLYKWYGKIEGGRGNTLAEKCHPKATIDCQRIFLLFITSLLL